MSERQVREAWERHWDMGGSLEENASFIGRLLRAARLRIMAEMLVSLDKCLSVIDLGCGNGSTLRVIRDAGFKDSIGLEYTDKGLDAAERNGFRVGVDLFQGDAGKTPYPNRRFGIVYSEGLWEHFEDPTPYMDEFIRIADRYIMVIQPDHYSFFGRLMKIGWDFLESEKGGVKEYSFRLEFFHRYLAERGFRLVQSRSTWFREQEVLLYERVS